VADAVAGASGTTAFRELPLADQALMMESILLLAAIRCALAVATVRAVHAALALTSSATRRGDTSPADRVLAMARLVDRASRYTVATTCLHRSLALWWLLGRRGIDSRLQLGLRKHDGRFEAHAWVEYGGLIVNDGSGASGYAPLAWTPLKHQP
jgi:transglutaminase superfamily protein